MSNNGSPPSAKGLWAILWRATIWFPLVLVGLCFVLAVPFTVILLAVWTTLYALQNEWIKAAGCLSALIAMWWIWNFAKRYRRTRQKTDNASTGGGYLL